MASSLLDTEQEQDPLNPVEATLAVVGLTHVLMGDMPFIGVMKQREIMAMPKRIANVCDELVNDKLPRKLKMPPPFSYDKMLETFTQPIPDAAIERILGKFPPNVHDQGMAFVQYLAGVYRHVADMLPVQEYQTLLGTERIDPTEDKLWQFWNRYWVINDPTVCLILANAGALLPEQYAVMCEFYPTLCEHIKSGLLQALMKRKLREPKFLNLLPRQQLGVDVLLQQKTVPFQSNQHNVAPDQLKQAAAMSKVSPKSNQQLQTQGQKAQSV